MGGEQLEASLTGQHGFEERRAGGWFRRIGGRA